MKTIHSVKLKYIKYQISKIKLKSNFRIMIKLSETFVKEYLYFN